MTLASLLSDCTYLFAFLLAGYFIREFVKPIQKLYIPSSVIGGVLALILGPQVLGIVEIPTSFSSMAGTLQTVVVTAVIFGSSVDKKRVASYMDYTLMMFMVWAAQMAVGTGLGDMLMKIWPDLPIGWGIQAVNSFWGGHGTASAAGAVFQTLGLDANMDIGMILSTIGLVAAIITGMVFVNLGIRQGKATYLQKHSASDDKLDIKLAGTYAKEEQEAIGNEVAPAISINCLALQAAWLMVSVLVGTVVMNLVAKVIPAVSTLPAMLKGILGALILWPVLCKLKLDSYVDKKTINNISGFLLELVITSAVATININVAMSYAAPIIIMSIVMVLLNIVLVFGIGMRMCKVDAFEKCCTSYGAVNGAIPTGLALLRCVDPYTESGAADACGIGNCFMSPFFTTFGAVGPLLVVSGSGSIIGFGTVCTIIALLVAKFVFMRK